MDKQDIVVKCLSIQCLKFFQFIEFTSVWITIQKTAFDSSTLNKLPETYLNYYKDGYIVSAIPTILVDKPKTLVGMGDTISSVSLLAGL